MMATMKNLLLLYFCMLLAACDQFPGPNIRSEFSIPVKLTVTYSNGETFFHEWPPCRVFGLGSMGEGIFGVKQKEEVTLERIDIEAEGKIIHTFDGSLINLLLEKEKNELNELIWVVDGSGIRFSKDMECTLRAGV